MAGELVASLVVKELVTKLGSWLWSDLGLLWKFKDDLEEMKTTLVSVQAVLHDAEKRSFSDETVRFWLKRLKAAAYDMEDMLDEPPTHNRLLYSPIIAHKLKGMRTRLTKIAQERSSYNLLKDEEAISYEKEAISYEMKVIRERETCSAVFKDGVLGRDQEATQIINRLLMSTTTNQSSALSIIPIVGIGGLGKTTLAKLIYNDDRIKEVFELRIWVHAVNLEVETLVEAILSKAKAENRNNPGDLHSKMRRAKKILQGKMYLIVLDDVWSEDWQKWNAFKQILQCGGKRESKIIVTTRSERVSSIMDATVNQHKLKPLSDDVCLELFERRAFVSADVKDNNLVSIGKEIVKKCQGVPLIANALGGMLHFDKGEAAWENVRDSDLWELKEEEGSGSSLENKILPSLKLSYQHMPLPLKQCFIYCCLYPKAFNLDRDTLIQQWITQRFIGTEDETEVQQIGDRYINYLLSMSFLEETAKDTYKMQELVHDLARWVAGDEVSILDPRRTAGDEVSIIDKVKKQSEKTNVVECRYASIIEYHRQPELKKTGLPVKVRALHLQRSNLVPKIFSYTKHLRVLELSTCPLGDLPTSIYKLKQLRYLKLDGIVRLDKRIKKLQTLESLIISSSWSIHALPTSIGELRNLIYLCISDCSRLLELPNSIGSLQKLYYLKLVGCYSLGSLPESLGNLVNLTILKIINCSIGSDSVAILDKLENLISLDLSFSRKLLELPLSIERHQKLDTLELASCISLERLPVSVGGLWNLQILDIQGCLMLDELPEAIYTNRHLDIKRDEPLTLGDDSHVTLYLVNGGPSTKYVVHNICDAKRTNLEGRRSIESLTYECTHNMGSNLGKIEKAMMEKLKPPETLQELCIRHYSGSSFPSWKEELCSGSSFPDWVKVFPNLIKIRLSKINACPNLPVLGQLPKLEEIFISEMPYVTRISVDFCGARNRGSSFISLKKLHLRDMEKLKEWETAEASEGHRQMFPCLEHLTMHNCPKLRVKDIDKCIPASVRILELGGSALPILTDLDGGIHKSLKTLRINDLKDMIDFPESIASLISLETLVIKYCKSVATLPEWLEKLSSLQSLKMVHCPLIDRLPQSIGRLEKLRSLVIIGSSESLFDRTREGTGEDWKQISHIEGITITLDYSAD